jgi:hypothetical protein
MGCHDQAPIRALLAFIRERGAAHPREIDRHFAHGKTTNYWGGSSNATTHLLNAMHYRGLLRVVRRDAGVRVYAVQDPRPNAPDSRSGTEHLRALIDIIVQKYAPLPAASLVALVGRLRYAAPQWAGMLKRAVAETKERLAHASVDGREWYWPADERPDSRVFQVSDRVRLLSPFDPVVWDRRRFEHLWGWAYRFEAYTPKARRKLGYYALPLLWRDQMIGWGNLTWKAPRLECRLGFVGRKPQETAFHAALDDELARFRAFLA